MRRLDPWQERRVANGCCLRCNAPTGVATRKRASGRAPTTSYFCRACLDRKNAARAARDQSRVAECRCVRCGLELVNPSLKECARCRSRANRWYAMRRGNPLPPILPHRTPPPPRTWTRRPLPGMKPEQLRAVSLAPAPGINADRRLSGRSERPCSRCGQRFAPTLRRRMLCAYCFHHGDAGPDAA